MTLWHLHFLTVPTRLKLKFQKTRTYEFGSKTSVLNQKVLRYVIPSIAFNQNYTQLVFALKFNNFL